MDQHILNGFLLATAEQSWPLWWNDTRVHFADFLAESGKEAESLALRTMECVIADEWGTEGRRLHSLYCRNLQMVESWMRLEGYSTVRGGWWSLMECPEKLDYAFRFGPEHQGMYSRLRLHFWPTEEMTYELVAEGGTWHGTLSLDRAQRRCRRRVLEMFPDHMLGKVGNPKWIHDVFHDLFADYSPRWVPHQAAWSQEQVANPLWYRAGDTLHMRIDGPDGPIHLIANAEDSVPEWRRAEEAVTINDPELREKRPRRFGTRWGWSWREEDARFGTDWILPRHIIHDFPDSTIGANLPDRRWFHSEEEAMRALAQASAEHDRYWAEHRDTVSCIVPEETVEDDA